MNDPGERTSIAQGSYLNFVSRKLVRVSPSRKAGMISAIILKQGRRRTIYTLMISHQTRNGCLSAGLEVSIWTRLLPFSCTQTACRWRAPLLSQSVDLMRSAYAPILPVLTYHKKKQSSVQCSPKYQHECPLLPTTEPPAVIRGSVRNS